MSIINKLNDYNFEQFLAEAGDKPVIIDFSATWCGPCKKVHPIIEELKNEYADKIEAGIIDVGESPAVAQKFGVISVPQVLLFKNKTHMETVYGAASKKKYLKVIKKYTD